jgi:hypothetical protein
MSTQKKNKKEQEAKREEKRVCPYCGKEFIVRNARQKLCGDVACKRAYQKKRLWFLYRTDAEYRNRALNASRAQRALLSVKYKTNPEYRKQVLAKSKARLAAHPPLGAIETTAVCSVCGVKFVYLRKTATRYKCDKCRVRNKRQDNNPKSVVEESVVCKICGKKFVYLRYIYDNHFGRKREYCEECRAEKEKRNKSRYKQIQAEKRRSDPAIMQKYLDNAKRYRILRFGGAKKSNIDKLPADDLTEQESGNKQMEQEK